MQLHPTSLPGGRLGTEANAFVDWLAEAGQSWWSVLPLGPPDEVGSPHAARSAFAASRDLLAEPATMKELDRQLNLNESILRTKGIRPDRSDPSILDVGQLCGNQTGGHGTGSVLQVSIRGLPGPARSQLTTARYMKSWASGGDEPFGRRVSQRHPFRSDRVQAEPG